MSTNNRAKAITTIAAKSISCSSSASPAKNDFYGKDVFNTAAMRKYLPKEVAEKLLSIINDKAPFDPELAGGVAHGMKQWALDNGVTHFTHWFQPLTGATAEKHDSFLDPKGDKAIMSFSGKNLIVGEPDASSFPSGGLRCTFEARGYTAWDPTSPAFIKRHGNGATLCIPTAFCSYTGEALDKKTPLLRSMQAISGSVKRMMKCFNQGNANVSITLGPEQEYFLIDKNFYLHRPDLLQTGRTVFGAPPPKHQQLDDHYFGAIKLRVLNFMADVEAELWRLGIPAKTRHNEVAPAQLEFAPMFEDVNLAVDHNMLAMEVLRQTAERHGLVCLMHEKPFAGINGSGKHNNWSLSYGGTNLLDPGRDPHQNAIFLTTLCAIIQAIDIHSDLLRSTVAHVGNDHRLGANEAPPAIISIFLGEQLSDVIEQIEKGGATSSRKAGQMRIGVDTLPELPRDATDRNRTSPFAFTGNKFEFRALGSSQSCAGPNTVLNTIVAEALDSISDKLEKCTAKNFNAELQKILQAIIKKHKRIIFNGDNYSEAWRKEAAKRGLPNTPVTPEALKAITAPGSIALLEKYNVLTAKELKSRHEVFLEEYNGKLRIEAEIALEIARSMIIPAVTAEYKQTVSAMNEAKNAGISAGIKGLSKKAETLGKGLDKLCAATSGLESALDDSYDKILTKMVALREIADCLELVVEDKNWPLPKYREMLFVY
ncbi:MAG: glutamine synthetase III [Victivallales bacterium]